MLLQTLPAFRRSKGFQQGKCADTVKPGKNGGLVTKILPEIFEIVVVGERLFMPVIFHQIQTRFCIVAEDNKIIHNGINRSLKPLEHLAKKNPEITCQFTVFDFGPLYIKSYRNNGG